MLSYDKLSPDEITAALAKVPGWGLVDGALTRTFGFDSYKKGLDFALRVGHTAEELNHHPDILIGYKRVVVSMVTHDAGNGLTSYDFELARRIGDLN